MFITIFHFNNLNFAFLENIIVERDRAAELSEKYALKNFLHREFRFKN